VKNSLHHELPMFLIRAILLSKEHIKRATQVLITVENVGSNLSCVEKNISGKTHQAGSS